MIAHRLTRILVRTAAVAGSAGAVAVAPGSATAPAAVTAPATISITGAGAGHVKLGATYASLRKRHLIGRAGKGCELAGPTARSAALRSPLKGGVDFTMKSPRKVADIGVKGGASARGVGIGATIAQIKAAFPKAKIDHSTDHTFALTVVRIPKSGGGKFEFGVETSTHEVSLIGIPAIAFCE